MILFMMFMIFLLECMSGFVLFRKVLLKNIRGSLKTECRASIIIPARNEEKNLPNILESLKNQTLPPYEIIVIDDFSSDETASIAESYGVRVIHNMELPEGWTGKTWAVWNGYLESTGNILVFLDADVTLAPRALETLLKTRESTGGVISVVPYHHTERFYERLSLVPYILGIFAFTSPFERKNPKKGLYGSCIVATREDYELIKGHESIKGELLDDLNLGRKFIEAGVSIENYLGNRLVSFRMYPNGIKSELQGFGKGAVLSTATLTSATVIFVAVWLVGLLVTGLILPFFIIAHYTWIWPFLAGYILYILQIKYFLKYTGRYGLVMPVLNLLSSLFFIIIMLYSIYQVKFIGSISWKGRQVGIGGRKIQ